MPFPHRQNAKQSGGFDVTNASLIAVADNPSRVELTLTNGSVNDISLKLRVSAGVGTPANPTAVAGDGIVLKANGGSWTTTSYSGPVAAIAAIAGPSRLAVTEI